MMPSRRVCTTVSIVYDDPVLHERFLQDYPERLFEPQFHIDDSGEGDEPRQYWISGLDFRILWPFLVEHGTGNYALYRDGARNQNPVHVHHGISALEMS